MSTPPAAAPIAVLAIHHQPVPAALPAVPTPVTMTSSFIVAASTPATLSYTNSAPASFSPSSLSSTSLSGSKASPPAVACLPPTAAVMNGSTVGGTGSTNGTTTSGGGSTSGKDSGWLTLEVCREHVRQRCTRSDNECRFAHPPPHVDIQNGRVVCCFDSIKGRCQRTEPPCKYLHPPQHLKEQLLQNGRHNLIMKNLQQISRIHQHTAAGANGAATTVLPTATAFIPVVNPYLLVNQSNCYASYYNGNSVPPTAIVTPTSGSNGCIVPGVATPSASVAPPADQSVQEVEPGSSGAVDGCTYSTVQTTTGGNQPPGTQQYWTLSPSGGTVYTTNPLATPYYSHCSPVYYQNGSYAIPATAGPAGTTMLLAKRTPMAGGSAGVPVTANGLIEGCGGSKNGYLPSAAAAVYGPCSTAAYQQMALSTGPIDLPSCYPMAITVPPPISGFYGC